MKVNSYRFIQHSIDSVPKGWKLMALKDIGTFSKGKGISKEQLSSTGLPCIRYGEIYTTHDVVIKQFKSFISEEIAEESQMIKKGDVLFAGSGETIEDIGKAVAYIGEERAYAGGDIIILSTTEEVHAEFLSYTLDTDIAKKQKRRLGQGQQVVHIYPSDLAQIKIPLPPLPEQKAIAACLSTWDNSIQKLTELIAQKELRKKWLMQVLLTGKKRLKGFEGVWREYTLNDLFDRTTRKNSTANENVVTISARDGFIKQTDFFSKTIASEITLDYFLINNGEFCYNKSYSNGYPWGTVKRLNEFNSAVVTTLYICFGLKDGLNNSGDFFEYYFEANLLDKGLMKIAHEGGRAHGLLNVTPKDFLSLKITIPQKPEQNAITDILQSADNELCLLKEKLGRLKEQKRGLMQVLLTGKVRVKTN